MVRPSGQALSASWQGSNASAGDADLDREQKLADKAFVQKCRQPLGDLGWFMKSLKEPLARLANKQDGCQGAFWQGRYKSIAILDEEALLATCA